MANKLFVVFDVNGLITDVSSEFSKLTGYTGAELKGKTLRELCGALHSDLQTELDQAQPGTHFWIFDKNLEPLELKIDKIGKNIIYFLKKPLDHIKEKFDYTNLIFTDMHTGVALLSAPDLVLLKSNDIYLSYQPKPFNTREGSFGRSKYEIKRSFKGSPTENLFMKAISTGMTARIENVLKPDAFGNDSYWDISVIPVPSAGGEIKFLIQIIKDVTMKSRHQQAARQHYLELATIINNMSDNLIIYDPSGMIIMLNDPAEAKIGDIRNIKDLFSKFRVYDLNGVPLMIGESEIQNLLDGVNVPEMRIKVDSSGSEIFYDLSINCIKEPDGEFSLGIILFRDVTYRVKAEESYLLKSQYDHLKNMVDNLGAGLIRYSYPDFHVLDTNQIAKQNLIAFKPELADLPELTGLYLFDLTPESDMSPDEFKKVIENCDGIYITQRKYSVGDEDCFFKILIQPLLGLNGKILELDALMIDITDEVKAKNKIESALKLQEEMFVNISHELKTPLSIIFNANELLELYIRKDMIEQNRDRMYRSLSIIKQNCYRFTRLINNVVDLAKIEAGFMALRLRNEPIAKVVEAISGSVGEFVQSRNLAITFSAEPDVYDTLIACDPMKIERVMLNLISNAIKFTNPGGEIFVEVRKSPDGKFIEIAVRDTGIGISNEHVSQIFERFRQVDKSLSRNAEGSGIGLSLVNAIVEMHGGEIFVESEPGKGSAFTVRLPILTLPPEAETETVAKSAVDNRIESIKIEFSDIYFG